MDYTRYTWDVGSILDLNKNIRIATERFKGNHLIVLVAYHLRLLKHINKALLQKDLINELQ